MEKIRNPTIYPVILSVPDKEQTLSGREMVKYLSRHARYALEISAKKSGIKLNDLLKDKNGAPLPFNGNYWSISHKPKYVAGVVAPSMIGVDIEKIRPCSDALLKKIADEKEWGLINSDPVKPFFRFWTSKEAVLKAAGIGIKGLSGCRIERVIDDDNLVINYMDRKWAIEHFNFNGHIASIVKNEFHIKWVISDLVKI